MIMMLYVIFPAARLEILNLDYFVRRTFCTLVLQPPISSQIIMLKVKCTFCFGHSFLRLKVLKVEE